MKPPIFGPFDVSRSPNLSDNKLINLYPEVVEGKQGKEVGGLYGIPGLDLLTTLGLGPIRGLHTIGATLYVVSGSRLYSVTEGFVGTDIGLIQNGPVSMIDNGRQLAVFALGQGVIAPQGFPLTAATVGAGGSGYVVGDTITLTQTGGAQLATASVRVGTIAAGVVTAFYIVGPGLFTTLPTGFTQARTDGAGTGFTLTAPTFSSTLQLGTIVLPFTTVGYISAAIQDEFGVINQPGPGSNLFFQSDLLDLSTWNPLNFGSASGDPDHLVAIHQLHRELWLIKEKETEIWYNAGTAGLTFARLDGAYAEVGCVAPQSVARAGESLIWLGRNVSGHGVVVQSHGHEMRRISTSAVEDAIRRYSTIADATAYVYQQDGHLFYVINFPTGDASWAYDVTASAMMKASVWHQRAALLNGVLKRHWADNHAFFAGKNVVGDYRNGNLYALNLETLTDNGTARKYLRSFRAQSQPTDVPTRFSSLRIDMQTGIAVGVDNPQMVLRSSDDGGHTWSNERYAPIGKLGETARRVMFRRLGSTRRNSGLDRVFEVSTTYPVPMAIIGAEFE